MSAIETPWYVSRRRRVLLDMHIDDWDAGFLAEFDPTGLVDLYAQAGITAAMFYCQSHIGLCYWPTKVGVTHAAFRDRDVVAEMVSALRAREIAACGYYSVTFNNRAMELNPEWRMQCHRPSDGGFPGPRYGMCCPNNPGYRAFALSQVDELCAYDLDGLFFDMTFIWPVCRCEHCRERYDREVGGPLPERVDWYAPEWCRYQAVRERWTADYARALTARAKAARPGMSVHHNFLSPRDWVFASAFEGADANDFLGADFYGGAIEQVVISRLYRSLSPSSEVEFMTSVCTEITDHVTLKTEPTIRRATRNAVAASSAMLFIDAVDPSGTVNPGVYERIGGAFAETAPYEPYAGGNPVEDVAVYFSGDSRMHFSENGLAAHEVAGASLDYPHFHAVRGACRALLAAHIPFGIATRGDLASLERYRVLILPNVLRMDDEEVRAVREYVRAGGKVYASRYTSLTHTEGRREPDFMLADVFGCHLGADDLVGSPERSARYPVRHAPNFSGFDLAYVSPERDELRALIAPQRSLTQIPEPQSLVGVVRLAAAPEGEVLATVSLPVSDEWGAQGEHTWSSIHSNPPWRHDVAPAIVRHAFGDGEAVYSAADIEVVDSPSHAATFVHLVRSLAGRPFSSALDAPGDTTLSVYDQPDRARVIATLLSEGTPVAAPPFAFELDPPAGARFVSARVVPDDEPVEFALDASGRLSASLDAFDGLRVLAFEYQR